MLFREKEERASRDLFSDMCVGVVILLLRDCEMEILIIIVTLDKGMSKIPCINDNLHFVIAGF